MHCSQSLIGNFCSLKGRKQELCKVRIQTTQFNVVIIGHYKDRGKHMSIYLIALQPRLKSTSAKVFSKFLSTLLLPIIRCSSFSCCPHNCTCFLKINSSRCNLWLQKWAKASVLCPKVMSKTILKWSG
jgi:hypothetical protein